MGRGHYERTPEHRARMSEAAQEFWKGDGYRERQQVSQQGKSHTQDPERYAAQNIRHSAWMKEQYAEGTEWAQAVLNAQSPNKLELMIFEYLKPLGWEFVGDGQVWIVGKNPDFIHRHDHRLIEIFGDYWHRPEEKQERIEHFARYGWPCEVIWESEIKTYLMQGAGNARG